MKKKRIILGLIVAALLIAGVVYYGLKNNIFADTSTNAINFYVATTGSDTNTGSIGSPFKTLKKARDYIRTIKPLTAPIVVNIRSGTYDPTYFSETASAGPFILDTRDSGTANFPITYQAYSSEKVIISGGQKVTGWQRYNGNLFVADAPSGTPVNLNSLYVSGESATRARTSTNYASADVDCASYTDKPLCTDKNSIRVPSAYVSPNWTNLSEVELVAFNSFKNPRLKIDSVVAGSDGKSDVFTKTDADVGINKVVPPNRYYFDNVFEALDSPGEWYFNKTNNKIYYYPKAGEDMNSLDVIAPKISMIMSVFQGSKTGDWSKDDNLVHDLNFKNLIFSYTNYNLGDPPRYNGAGHGYFVGFDTTKAAVRVYGSNRVNFTGNTFSHLGNFGFDAYSKNLQFLNNKIFDTGSGGIKIGAYLASEGWPSMDFSSSKIDVKSNTIHDIGKVFKDVSAVHWIPSGSDDISSNKIFNAPYRGLSIYNGASGDNLVAKNEIHDVMQELNDGGAIYAVSRVPVIIENNWIHDIKQVSGAQYRNWGINGIYLDEASEQKTIRNNLIENVSYGAITLNRSNNNIISNNIIVGGGEANIFISKFTTTESAVPTGNRIDKNIIVTKPEKRTICLYGSTDCNLSGFAQPLAPADLARSTIKNSNNNYFYNVSGSIDQSLTAWKSYGFEASSLIDRDPFVSYSQGQYCLKSASSANNLGISSIDMTSFGKPSCIVQTPVPTPTITVSASVTKTPTCSLKGDLNGDCKVNSLDLNILISHWTGKNAASGGCAQKITGDLNNDCQVNSLDLNILISNWKEK